MSTARPRYRPSSHSGATPATLRVDAVDANPLAAHVGLAAKLGLPHAVADDDPVVQRELEQIGEIGRHGGHGHDRRAAGQHDGALRLAGGAEPFERVERDLVSDR